MAHGTPLKRTVLRGASITAKRRVPTLQFSVRTIAMRNQLDLFMARKRRSTKPLAIRAVEPSETQLQISLVQHLKLLGRKGLLYFHPASGGLRTKSEAAKFKAMGVVPGIPDLIMLYAGKTYGLELKTKRGVVSADQRAMLDAFRSAGAFAEVAHGIDEALAILNRWGLLQPVAKAGQRLAVDTGVRPLARAA